MRSEPIDNLNPTCDCCGAREWKHEFSSNGFDLGYCRRCGLHYVAQIPDKEKRLAELRTSLFGEGQTMSDASTHREVEARRLDEFTSYVQKLRRYVPEGPWLDIGCGAGTFLDCATRAGVQISGIELTPQRQAFAETSTGCTVYGVPVEDAPIPSGSLAAVTLINVFSHLISPTQSLQRIHELLVPGGILLLRTSEAGPELKRRHSINWILGRHLHFLGRDTIDSYCDKVGFELLERDSEWQPREEYSRARYELRGPSGWKNTFKRSLLRVPGVIPAVRSVALAIQKGNPLFISTLVLRKPVGQVPGRS